MYYTTKVTDCQVLFLAFCVFIINQTIHMFTSDLGVNNLSRRSQYQYLFSFKEIEKLIILFQPFSTVDFR